ncbi:hypothetical protein ACKF11_00415 [Methylobacillus sp. Pita2]|jgi:ribosome biogenesis protein Tsr3|uniref:hypothetical protein n=1 Tax=Methylobacillus sp. Pita2 TaxID=3383245 RepID=UPI0038B519E2
MLSNWKEQAFALQTRHMPSIMANYVSHCGIGVENPFNAYGLLGVLQSVDALADCFCITDPAIQATQILSSP